MSLRRTVFGLLTALVPLTCFADEPMSLDRLVPLEQQKALGFDRLTPDERARVMQLLQEVYEVGVQDGQEQSNATSPTAPGSSSAIESKVDGEFNGWEGETIVKLMNGQIWQQIEYYYHYHYSFMPDVLVYPSGGGFKMKVDGVDRAVGVRRLH